MTHIRSKGRSLAVTMLAVPLAIAAQAGISAPHLAAASTTAEEPRAASPWNPAGPRHYEPAEISGRAAHDGVTQQVAAQRLALEDDAAVLLEQAARRWPSTFAGSWMADQGDSVVVAFTQSADANVAELARTFPSPSRLRPKTVALSMGELLRIHDRMRADRDRLLDVAQGRRPASEVAELPAAMRATRGQYAVDLDVQNNTPLAFAMGPRDELASALERRYAAKAAVRPGGPVGLECSREYCNFSMRGGLAMNIPCTTGFSAFGGSGRRFFLTAGHCGYEFWIHGGSGYGNTDRADWDSGMDAARVVDDSPTAWSHVGRVWVESYDQRVIRYFQRFSAMQLETQVLKTGAFGGTDRGVIKSFSFSAPTTTRNYVRSTYCSEGGDSGGAVLRNDVAWGLHGGSSNNLGAGFQCGQPNHYSLFQAIEPALNRLSVSLITG